jgi:hypothetical protein
MRIYDTYTRGVRGKHINARIKAAHLLYMPLNTI